MLPPEKDFQEKRGAEKLKPALALTSVDRRGFILRCLAICKEPDGCQGDERQA